MRQNAVNNFVSQITFCRQHEILPCVTKVVNEKLSKRNCCRQQQKRIDSFSLFKRENASMRFSDLPLFAAQNMSLCLCFKTVIDHKKLLKRKVIN